MVVNNGCVCLFQMFGSVTFLPAYPDLFDKDPPQNVLRFKMSTTLLMIGFRNYRENYIKTGQYNNETNFDNLTDPKTWIVCGFVVVYECVAWK
jgi:hypothetical protein